MARRPISFWVQVMLLLVELAQKLESLFDCDDEDINSDG